MTSIRNQLDYSPQAIYWIGSQVVEGTFKWLDGTEMGYKVKANNTYFNGFEIHLQ